MRAAFTLGVKPRGTRPAPPVDEQKFDSLALSSAALATVYAEDHAAVCVNDVKDEAAERGVPVVGETLHGVPHDVILKYAADVDADVIVVGEHGDHLDHFSGIRKRVADRSDRKVDVVKAEM